MEQAGLELDNVLLDSGGRLGQHVGSTAPHHTFYNAEGRQVGSHLGELSLTASLARALETLKRGIYAVIRTSRILHAGRHQPRLHFPPFRPTSCQRRSSSPKRAAPRSSAASMRRVVWRVRGALQRAGHGAVLTPDGERADRQLPARHEGGPDPRTAGKTGVRTAGQGDVGAHGGQQLDRRWQGRRATYRHLFQRPELRTATCSGSRRGPGWRRARVQLLRHIMVGMLRADSAGKSAALLSAMIPRRRSTRTRRPARRANSRRWSRSRQRWKTAHRQPDADE